MFFLTSTFLFTLTKLFSPLLSSSILLPSFFLLSVFKLFFSSAFSLIQQTIACSKSTVEMRKCWGNVYQISNIKWPLSNKSHLKAHPQVWVIFWQLKGLSNDEKCFLFHLQSSFRSWDILVFVLMFLSCGKKALQESLKMSQIVDLLYWCTAQTWLKSFIWYEGKCLFDITWQNLNFN